MAKVVDLIDFRQDSNRYAGFAALLLVTPFSIVNLLGGHFFLGLFSLAVIVLFLFNSWRISCGRPMPLLAFLGLMPAAVICLGLAVYERGMIGVLWCYPAVLVMYLILQEKQAWLSSLLMIAMVVALCLQTMDWALTVRIGMTLLTVSVFAGISLRLISRQQERLHQFAVTDPLTGLSNRLLLGASLEQAINYSRRTASPMTLLAIDLDHFKRVNDELGHDAGDQALRNLADLLQARVRRSDQLFRWGGEEFLALLYGTDAEAGLRVAEHLRQAIENAPLLPGRKITASMGLATLQSGETWKEWVKRSDRKLYQAKHAGRNRVCE